MAAFDGEQLAADVGPGKTGDHADLILVLDLAVAVLRHAEIVGEVLRVTCTDFFFESVSSFTALRISVEISRSRLRTPASRV